MEKINLKGSLRKVFGKKVNQIRKDGFLPAVIYGKDTKPENIQFNLKEFEKTYQNAGSSTLVDLSIEDKNPVKVLIQDVQYDPVKDVPIHADLYAIKMDEKITTNIPVKFIGVSPAVKDLEGNFIANYDEIEVECLPGDLISEIEVDVSGLKTFEDNIKISDLKIPSNIKVLSEPDEVVALVNPPRSEEELKEMEEQSATDTEKEAVEKMEEQAETEKAEKEAQKEEAETKEEPNKK